MKKAKEDRQLAVITGGAKRIGAGIARKLAKMGYDLVITYNNSKKEAELLRDSIINRFKVNCYTFKCDLLQIKQLEKLILYLTKNHCNWSILVNNASIFNRSKFISSSIDDLLKNLQIHLISPIMLSRALAQNITANKLSNGHIINMVDKNIARFDTSYFNYLLSKKFLAETTKMLSLELAPQIRVNAIAPGFILKSVDNGNKTINLTKITTDIPLKSKGNINNIEQTIEFLISNKFITGQIIFIDGGASLNHAR